MYSVVLIIACCTVCCSDFIVGLVRLVVLQMKRTEKVLMNKAERNDEDEEVVAKVFYVNAATSTLCWFHVDKADLMKLLVTMERDRSGLDLSGRE